MKECTVSLVPSPARDALHSGKKPRFLDGAEQLLELYGRREHLEESLDLAAKYLGGTQTNALTSDNYAWLRAYEFKRYGNRIVVLFPPTLGSTGIPERKIPVYVVDDGEVTTVQLNALLRNFADRAHDERKRLRLAARVAAE